MIAKHHKGFNSDGSLGPNSILPVFYADGLKHLSIQNTEYRQIKHRILVFVGRVKFRYGCHIPNFLTLSFALFFDCFITTVLLTLKSIVMVNFMYLLDWVTGCPNIWSNIILGVSVGIIWMRLAFKFVVWAKQIAFPNIDELHPMSWKPE